MKKIISLFQRNYDGDRLVRDEIVPGAEWVVAGKGIATRKWDGTCCLVRDGQLFRRYDAKDGRTPPDCFEPAQPKPDPVTGHWPGWLPVGVAPEDKWHLAALRFYFPAFPGDGSYELVGVGVQGNVERLSGTYLIRHGAELAIGAPRDFAGLREYLEGGHIEGIVWHHPDGRMVKIKGKDFGVKRRQAVAQ